MLCSCLKAQLSCVPEQNWDTGEIRGLQRMPNRISLMMLLHGLDAGKSCWKIALTSVTDVNSQACGVEILPSVLFILFLSSLKMSRLTLYPHFPLHRVSSIPLMHTLSLP